uniref:Uncharacterized protein n=1 Tax=Calidris pygmaea TaxID=425635 RepID=A0A8C3KRP3_9CHAR
MAQNLSFYLEKSYHGLLVMILQCFSSKTDIAVKFHRSPTVFPGRPLTRSMLPDAGNTEAAPAGTQPADKTLPKTPIPRFSAIFSPVLTSTEGRPHRREDGPVPVGQDGPPLAPAGPPSPQRGGLRRGLPFARALSSGSRAHRATPLPPAPTHGSRRRGDPAAAAAPSRPPAGAGAEAAQARRTGAAGAGVEKGGGGWGVPRDAGAEAAARSGGGAAAVAGRGGGAPSRRLGGAEPAPAAARPAPLDLLLRQVQRRPQRPVRPLPLQLAGERRQLPHPAHRLLPLHQVPLLPRRPAGPGAAERRLHRPQGPQRRHPNFTVWNWLLVLCQCHRDCSYESWPSYYLFSK